MKLLFDANLSPDLVARLSDLYPASDHVSSFGIAFSDTAVWEYARSQGFAIVSKDSDFHQRALVSDSPPKVVWIRLGNCRPSLVESLLRQRFREVGEFIQEPGETVLALP